MVPEVWAGEQTGPGVQGRVLLVVEETVGPMRSQKPAGLSAAVWGEGRRGVGPERRRWRGKRPGYFRHRGYVAGA